MLHIDLTPESPNIAAPLLPVNGEYVNGACFDANGRPAIVRPRRPR
jgi:hypothetical protein